MYICFRFKYDACTCTLYDNCRWSVYTTTCVTYYVLTIHVALIVILLCNNNLRDSGKVRTCNSIR